MRKILILGICWLLVSCNRESSLCDQYKDVYCSELSAIVIRKYITREGGRRTGHIVVKENKGKVYDFKGMNIDEKVFDSIAINDVSYKRSNSALFEFYRKDDYLGDISFGCHTLEVSCNNGNIAQ